MTSNAYVLRQDDDKVTGAIEALGHDQWPDGDVSIAVDYSTLNYKDGLILQNKAPLVRNFPHIPGIDLAGTVTASDHPDYAVGDKVVLNGWGVGERHWGGFAQHARVKGDWLVKLPDGLSTRQAMAIGTAGYTAMLCVLGLEDHGAPKAGPVLVTGAAGGVGSVAIAILAHLGYAVTAATGRAAEHDYLRALGAAEIIGRDALAGSGKPLEKSLWAGAVDTVGGDILATVIAQMAYGAPITMCGNAAGAGLKTTVLPFILRGVNLLGIDSVMCPKARRQTAWDRLATDLPLDKLADMTHVHPMSELDRLSADILQGQVRGRTVIDVNA